MMPPAGVAVRNWDRWAEVEKRYQPHPCLPPDLEIMSLQIDVLKFECEFQSMSLCFQIVVSKSIRSYW
jgi:hypothetical protein